MYTFVVESVEFVHVAKCTHFVLQSVESLVQRVEEAPVQSEKTVVVMTAPVTSSAPPRSRSSSKSDDETQQRLQELEDKVNFKITYSIYKTKFF